MTKVVIIYESKYGNTKKVAETILKGISEIKAVDAVLKEPKEMKPPDTKNYDVILIGSPNHIGSPTRRIRKFIDKLGKTGLENKVGAVFDTYLGGDYNKAVSKMEKRINEKVPGLKLLVPGLSIEVQGMKGPILEGELPKCKDFGVKIAKLIKN